MAARGSLVEDRRYVTEHFFLVLLIVAAFACLGVAANRIQGEPSLLEGYICSLDG